MKSYFVYMLNCSDNSIYVGFTNNIDRRLEEHKYGIIKTCFTFKRRPLKLIFYQKFEDAKRAIDFEKKLKKWSRAKKLALAEGNFKTLRELSTCKNNSNSIYFNDNSD